MRLKDLFEKQRRTPTQMILVKAAKDLYNECFNFDADSGATLGQVAIEMMQENYIDYDEEIYNGIENLKYNSRIFKNALKEYCNDQVESKYQELMQLFYGTELPIWRMITAPKDWQPSSDVHPGIYWSWNENAAEAHWGNFHNGNVKWLLHAKVTYNDIDWVKTIVQNCHKSYEDEKEITLLGKPIKILD